MPGYEFEVNGEVIVDFICCICLMLIKRALLLPCSHTACKECLEKWENEHPGRNRCPTCNNPYDNERVRKEDQGKYIDRLVTNNVKVKCKQWEEGCEWVGTIADYDVHEKTCDCVQLPCRFEDCKTRVASKDMSAHEQYCPYRPVSCNFCQLNVILTKMEEHLNLCEEYQVGCSSNGCDRTMKRKELNHHISEECPFVILPCSFKNIGCTVQMARCESEKHFVDFSSFHSSLLLKTTDSLTHQLKQQQLDFQQQEKRHKEEMNQLSQKFEQKLKQQQLQQEKRHTEEMENLRERLDKFEKMARFERLQPTKEELSLLSTKEKSHKWTNNELLDLLRNKDFDKFNAVLISFRQLSKEQNSDEHNNNNSLLHSASYRNAPLRTLQLLIEKGCNLRDRNDSNNLPIHSAAVAFNNYKTVEWMLHVDISLLNEKGLGDWNPLHLAAKYNNKETVKLLLSYGADLNAKTDDGKKAHELSQNDEIKKLFVKYRRRWR